MDPSGHFLIELGVVSFFVVAVLSVATTLAIGIIGIYSLLNGIITGIRDLLSGFWNWLIYDSTFDDIDSSVGAGNNGSQNSSNIKNLYELYGGPGNDLREAIYEEYGLSFD